VGLRLALVTLVAWCAVASAQTAPKDHPISLANGHKGLACVKCHDQGIGKTPSKGKTCKDCHARGHDTDFGPDCERCHGSIIWLSVPEPLAREAHVKTPYPLLGKHQKAPCSGCHLDTTPAKDRFRLVSHDKCLSCHEDKHKGEFAAKDLGDCSGCHDNNGFDRTTFGLAQHTTWKVDGKHVATPCKSCHPGGLSFLVGGTQCLDCHQNPHGPKRTAEMTDKGCATCHDTSSWGRASVPHPAFALTGAHARTTCKGCHGAKAEDADAASFRGIPKTCNGCHDDTHAGQFAGKPCTDCHGTERWTKLDGFDHGKTRYPLEGVHVPMSCDACHARTTLRDGSTAVRWRLGYFRCRDCHATPHTKAIFAKDLDCKSCHAATAWTDMQDPGSGFDHRATGFALAGAHASVRCASCHRTSGSKPSRSCETCHHDPHEGRMDGACAECHTAVAWSATSELEQHRRTRMPLTGKHAVVECSACHTRQSERTWSDLPVDCYACHARAYHDAGAPRHDGDPPLSRECQLCHTTTGWTPARAVPVAQLAPHEAFELRGSHRDCDGCHVDRRRMKLVRCDACHTADALRAQHGKSMAPAAATCLRCHPRGTRR
jgi:hypothetical protein